MASYSDDEYSMASYSDDEYSMASYSDDEYGQYQEHKEFSKHEFNDWAISRPVEQEVQPGFQERTFGVKNEDKQSGTYERFTAKEKVSTGEMFVEKTTGRVGYKNEHKMTSTLKVGDKRGHTEYYTEQRTRKVNYDDNYNGNNGKTLNYGNTGSSANKLNYGSSRSSVGSGSCSSSTNKGAYNRLNNKY